MRRLKTYNDFINEEINLKKSLIGGAIAASTLAGCSTDKGSNYHDTTSSNKIEVTDPKELPNSMIFSQKFLTIGTDMTILDDNGNEFGVVEERVLSWGKKFEYLDNSGNLIASAKQRVFSLYTVIDITDASGSKIGSVEQEVIESLFSIYSIYSIKDASGNVLAKSRKLDFLTTDVDIEGKDGSISMSKDFINMFGDTWRIDMNSTIDKRLVVFIPSFISSKQSEKESE